MKRQDDLIFDIGVYNGDDTAYYLYKGFRVVGVEADPTLMPILQERFSTEIARGQLTLLNIALAEERKKALFWICEGYSLWNSFDREVAGRMGRKHYSIEVDCWPLRDLMQEHGIPHYLKMSLHGHEHEFLRDLQPEFAPPYLSIELLPDAKVADETLALLSRLGYGGFKVVNQATQKQLEIRPPTLKSRLRGMIQEYPRLYETYESLSDRARSLLRPAPGTIAEPANDRHAADGWIFPEGSSGPFGESTDGAWKGELQVRSDWRAFLSGETEQGKPKLSIWHDLHATREPRASA